MHLDDSNRPGTPTPSVADRQLITDLSRDLVAAVAPQEMPVFRPVSTAYFDDPERLTRGARGRDDMLGFGVGEVSVFLTPVALAVMTEVVAYLKGELARLLAHEASASVEDLVKALFRRFRPPDAESRRIPGLNREQLTEVRRIAFKKAREMHIGEERAGLLADATVGSLVLAA
jgi:hypothetical protein